MSALLAAGGASGAMSQLPVPFNIAGAVGGQLTAAAFADQLTSLKLTFAQFGGLSVDVKQEGLGSLKAAVTAERGITLEQAVEDTGEQSISASIFTSLGGSLGGTLGVGPLSGIGGSGSGSGRLFASLKYIPSKEQIKTIDAGASISAGVALNNVDTLINALPAPAAAGARAALQPYLGAHGNASVDAGATFKVTNLQKLIGELDAYFASPDNVTLEGTYDKVASHLASNNSLEISVDLTARSRLFGIGVSAEQSGQGGTVGVNVAASLDSGQKITLYKQTFTNLHL
jgi:hypothetical protein